MILRPRTYSRFVQSPLMIDLWVEVCLIFIKYLYTFHETGDEVLFKTRLQTPTKNVGAVLFTYLLTNTNIARIEFFMTKHVVGETHRELRERISEHRGYIHKKGTSQATGDHLNFPGHGLSDMKVMVIEKVKVNDVSYKKERESDHIRKFYTYYRGINRKPYLDYTYLLLCKTSVNEYKCCCLAVYGHVVSKV